MIAHNILIANAVIQIFVKNTCMTKRKIFACLNVNKFKMTSVEVMQLVVNYIEMLQIQRNVLIAPYILMVLVEVKEVLPNVLLTLYKIYRTGINVFTDVSTMKTIPAEVISKDATIINKLEEENAPIVFNISKEEVVAKETMDFVKNISKLAQLLVKSIVQDYWMINVVEKEVKVTAGNIKKLVKTNVMLIQM